MLTIGNLGLEEVRRRFQKAQIESKTRRAQMGARLDVEAGEHEHLIIGHIYKVFDVKTVKDELIKFVDTRRNICRRILDTCSVAYTSPPGRGIDGLDEAAEKRFLEAYQAAGIDQAAEQWSRLAFLCNVVHVFVRHEEEGLSVFHVTPDVIEPLFDPNDPAEPSIMIYPTEAYGAALVLVDSERWVWVDSRWGIVHEEEHGMGMRPWVAWRFERPSRKDYFCTGIGKPMISGTIVIGRLSAQLQWVRKGNSKKILHLSVGETDDVPQGQLVNGEDAFFSRGGNTSLSTIDNIVDPSTFHAEIKEIIEDLAESYGIPSTEIDPNPISTGEAANVFTPAGPKRYEALAKMRNKQIKHYERCEKDLAIRINEVLRHRGESTLTKEDIAKRFEVRFLPLNFTDHPKAQVETAHALMSVGATDPYEFYQQLRPGITRAQAKRQVDAHVKARAEYFATYNALNMPADPSQDLDSISQLQGRLGGLTKSANAEEGEPTE